MTPPASPAVLSFGTAALALAWVAIVVLALAVAGLIRQVRELRAVLVEGFGVSFLTGQVPAALRPGPGRVDAVVLVVESATASPELLAAFAEAAGTHRGTDFKVLLDGRRPGPELAGGVPTVADPRVFQLLRLPWYPALVHVDTDGTLSDAAPVGSAEALDRVLRQFQAARPAASSRRD